MKQAKHVPPERNSKPLLQ